MIKKCIICGKEFNSPPSAKTVTCSLACRSVRASKAARKKRPETVKQKISASTKGRDLSNIAEKAATAHKLSSKSGRFETNSSAKTYILISPYGERIEVTNLSLWARENCELFGFEPSDKNAEKISNGFYTIWKNIRKSQRGQTYKGWTITAEDRKKNCEKK